VLGVPPALIGIRSTAKAVQISSLSAENESSNKKVLDYQLVATKMGRLSPPHFVLITY
jgi:hypothetical protein